jgi:hypothetical protein
VTVPEVVDLGPLSTIVSLLSSRTPSGKATDRVTLDSPVGPGRGVLERGATTPLLVGIDGQVSQPCPGWSEIGIAVS